MGWGLRICISKRLLDDSVAGPQSTHNSPLATVEHLDVDDDHQELPLKLCGVHAGVPTNGLPVKHVCGTSELYPKQRACSPFLAGWRAAG